MIKQIWPPRFRNTIYRDVRSICLQYSAVLGERSSIPLYCRLCLTFFNNAAHIWRLFEIYAKNWQITTKNTFQALYKILNKWSHPTSPASTFDWSEISKNADPSGTRSWIWFHCPIEYPSAHSRRATDTERLCSAHSTLHKMYLIFRVRSLRRPPNHLSG